jgi:hypothetical protein
VSNKVLVDGKVRQGLQVGKLTLTTSRNLGKRGTLNDIQKRRLVRLGSYLKYLDNLPSSENGGDVEGKQTNKYHGGDILGAFRDFRKLPTFFLSAFDKHQKGVLEKEWFRSVRVFTGL